MRYVVECGAYTIAVRTILKAVSYRHRSAHDTVGNFGWHLGLASNGSIALEDTCDLQDTCANTARVSAGTHTHTHTHTHTRAHTHTITIIIIKRARTCFELSEGQAEHTASRYARDALLACSSKHPSVMCLSHFSALSPRESAHSHSCVTFIRTSRPRSHP
jgi:hypothetical protein